MKHTEQEPLTKSDKTRLAHSVSPSRPDETERRYKRFRVISAIIVSLLLLVIGFETAIILEQRRVTQQVEAQAEEAYGRFLKQGKAVATAGGTNIAFRNVRYCWSREICIDTDRLSATAIPLAGGQTLVFDDLKSFIVRVHHAQVLISPQTLQGMFNESVFNYPGSTLRNLTVGIEQAGRENRVKLAGSLKYYLWIPFEMKTNLKVDPATNTLVISVYKLKVFGFIPATWLIELKPFNLQKLLTLPPNKYLTVHQNQMRVKPFGLFPPPRIDGKMSAIAVTPQMIQLTFSGRNVGSSEAPPNSITLAGGNAQFGRIRMLNTSVQVLDQNPKDSFKFSLLNYLHYLPLSQVKLQDDGSAVLRMPDHANIPDLGKNVEHPQNDPSLQEKKAAEQKASGGDGKPGPWTRVKTKVKNWLKID